MVTGAKQHEYRKPSKWIATRLEKEYDIIKFVNGYGSDKPYFVCEFDGYNISNKNNSVTYGDSTVEVERGDYIISLGKILETGNIK